MGIQESYPPTYRRAEVTAILNAVLAGECVSVVGLSGAGKSNLLACLAQSSVEGLQIVLVDCNRLTAPEAGAFFRLVGQSLAGGQEDQELKDLEAAIARRLEQVPRLCLLLDRFDALDRSPDPSLPGNLRALRDRHKYALTFVTATRLPLNPRTELAELFYANSLWLGPLAEGDALWSASRYALRRGLQWEDAVLRRLVELSWGYPSLLRAACEAHAAGASLDIASLSAHPAVQRRLAEFWADQPGAEELRKSRLEGQPLLAGAPKPSGLDEPSFQASLTAKEHLLLVYFRLHPNEVCEKDDLIRAVWPEDKVYEQGIRDDSLAQLVRRLREKIEPDPSAPRSILTVTGRGYRYKPLSGN